MRFQALKAIPADLQFADSDGGRKSAQADETVSINLARRSILMYRLSQPDSPIELKCQPKYGSIVSYRWYGDGFVLVGFSEGFVVAVSATGDKAGDELQVWPVHDGGLHDLVFCDSLSQFATCGNNQVKIVDLSSDWKVCVAPISMFTSICCSPRFDRSHVCIFFAFVARCRVARPRCARN